MALEIERKFWVNADFKSYATSCSHIIQGYICSERGRTVRVRIRDHKGYLTIKGPSDKEGLVRYEFEKEISGEDANALIQLCEPGIIDKKRYLVPYEGHLFEVDEFYGENTGLVMAEVELTSIDEFFYKPAFLGKELTGDRRFYNSQLRANPFTLWGAEFIASLEGETVG